MASDRTMVYVRQPPGSKLCGQASVAMLAGCTLEEAARAIGKRGATRMADLVRGLAVLGIVAGERVGLRRGEAPPVAARGLARIRRRGSRWGGHWVVLDGEGRVLDPDPQSFAHEPVTIAGYLVGLTLEGQRFASYLAVPARWVSSGRAA